MTELQREERTRWVAAGVGGLVVLLAVMRLFRVPEPPVPTHIDPAPAVTLTPGGSEESKLLDPAPLFLPTRWNAAPAPVRLQGPTGSFDNFPAKWATLENVLDLGLPPPVPVPANPVEGVMVDPPGSGLLGLGRTDLDVPPVAERGAQVEIVETRTGRRVPLTGRIPPAQPPGKGEWEPMEFLVAVDAAGLVGPVAIQTRSGVDEVDAYFQNYLAKTLRVGERLGPGFYRISVGP